MAPLKHVEKATNLGSGIHLLCSFNRMDELPMIEDVIALLQTCRRNRDLKLIEEIHLHICCTGLDIHHGIGNHVVPLLVECSGLGNVAQQAFSRMDHHSIHSWNSLISGFAKCGQLENAVGIYQQMREDNEYGNSHTFVALLQSCTATEALDLGQMLHSTAIQDGFESDVFICSSVVDMYSKIGLFSDAKAVFDQLSVRDVFTWNALMAAQGEQGFFFDAFVSFERMRIEGVHPDSVSYLCILKACGFSEASQRGRITHVEYKESSLEGFFVNNTLIDMYTKCGCLAEARLVFDSLVVRDVVTWNALVAGYTGHGSTQEALDCFMQMQSEDVAPDVVSYVFAVKACGISGQIGMGQVIHSEVISKGFEGEDDIGSCLAHMYANNALLSEAQIVFDKLSSPSALAWNALIDGFEAASIGQGLMDLYWRMQVVGALSNPAVYACCMKLCGSVGVKEECQLLFKEVLQKGLEIDVFIGRSLISMHTNFGALLEAQAILETLCVGKLIAAWNALLAAFVEHGLFHDALRLFGRMKWKGLLPDAATFIYVLQACGSLSVNGQIIHKEVVELGLENTIQVGNALLCMYAKHGLFAETQSIFNHLRERDTVSWNTLISAYPDFGDSQEVMKVYRRMQAEGILRDCITMASVLKACGNARALEGGQELHSEVLKQGLEGDTIVSNVLIFMYFKCYLCSDGNAVFNTMPDKNVVTWNTMIAGYVDCGLEHEAENCFEQMQLGTVSPNHVTFACVLQAYIASRALDKGQHLHSEIVLRGLEENLVIGNLLVDMYAKLGALAMAQYCFDMLSVSNVVSWTALIAAYAEYGPASEALCCLKQMQANGVLPDAAAYASALKACRVTNDVESAQTFHNEVVLKGFERDLAIGNTLVSVYARSVFTADAHQVFSKLEAQNAMSWMGLGLGYAENGYFEETLRYLEKMQSAGVVPDARLYACILASCSDTGAIEKGLELHVEIVQRGYETDLFVTSSLIHVYATCGFLAEAINIFDKLPIKNVVSWSAMIKGFGMNREGALALQCFNDMRRTGLTPNEITLTNLMSACGRSSLILAGQDCSSAMAEDGSIKPTMNYLTSAACLLSRAGLLNEAKKFLMTMPCSPSKDTWIALLTSCKLYLEADLGHSCFEHLVHKNASESTVEDGTSLNGLDSTPPLRIEQHQRASACV